MKYSEYLEINGISIDEANPGSTEIALLFPKALEALSLLEKEKWTILGGDILTEDTNKKLIYAYQLWGSKYAYLNWTCSSKKRESSEVYFRRSLEVAFKSMLEANRVAKKLHSKCYIVFVIRETPENISNMYNYYYK